MCILEQQNELCIRFDNNGAISALHQGMDTSNFLVMENSSVADQQFLGWNHHCFTFAKGQKFKISDMNHLPCHNIVHSLYRTIKKVSNGCLSLHMGVHNNIFTGKGFRLELRTEENRCNKVVNHSFMILLTSVLRRLKWSYLLIAVVQ